MVARPLDGSTWAKFQDAITKQDLVETTKTLLDAGMDLNLSMGIKGTPLCSAIEAGATDTVQYLIHLKCDVNKNNEDGESPLSLAIRKKNIAIINLLIEAGSVVANDQSKLGDLPLCDAVRFNWASVVEKLLHYGAEVNALNHDYDTALHLSISLGHRKITDILLSHGADPLMYNDNCEASIHVAAMMGDLKSIHTIVNFIKSSTGDSAGPGDGPTTSQSENSTCSTVLKYLDHPQRLTGRSLLHIAVANSCVEMVKYLIDAGCNINTRSFDGETPLSLACCDSNSYLVKLLVEAGCNVNAPAFDRMQLRFRTLSSKTYPLHIAVCKGSLAIFKCLVEAGADVNTVNEKENSPLSIAFKLTCSDIIDYLLAVGPEKGLDLKEIIMRNHGRNPLLDVVNCDSEAPEIARKLIMLGCPLDSSGRNNHMTPLHAAVEQECLDLMRTLLLHGADMRLYDRDGHMSVHLCAIYGLDDTLQVLLEHGTDVNWKAEDSDSCLILAIANSNMQIVKKLLKAGHRLPIYPFLEDEEMNDIVKVSEVCNIYDFELFYDLQTDEPELFEYMKSLCREPPSLAVQSCRVIRDYFVRNRIHLSKIEQVDLPSALKCMVQMKDF